VADGGGIEALAGPEGDVVVARPAAGAAGRAFDGDDPPVDRAGGRVDGAVAVEGGAVAVVPAAAPLADCPFELRRLLKFPPVRIPPDWVIVALPGEPAEGGAAGELRAARRAVAAPSLRANHATTPMARSMATRHATRRISCCRNGPTSPGSLRVPPFLREPVDGRIPG
jgi:hypothetical protein